MTRTRWLVLLLLVGAALILAAFTVQNASREVVLSLNLGVVAWRLKEPVSASTLVWVSFAAGVVLTWLSAFRRGRVLRQRIARLEQEAILRETRGDAAAPPG